MPWPFIWKNARRLKARLSFKPATRPVLLSELLVRNGMPLSSEGVAFDLAADFLYSIVIPIDLMTLQATDIRYTLEKLAGVPLGDAKDASFCAGIDKDLSLFTKVVM